MFCITLWIMALHTTTHSINIIKLCGINIINIIS